MSDGDGESLKVEELREPWTVMLTNGEFRVIRWTEEEAAAFIDNPNRSIAGRDEGGRLMRVVFPSAIAMVMRGMPSPIAVPKPAARVVRA